MIYFPDVEGHWAEQYIEKLAEEGIVTGKADGLYHPSDPITRAEIAVIASKVMAWDNHKEKGLAFVHQDLFPNDPETLGCTWSYNWGLSGNVPMSGKGDITGIDPLYNGYLLLFNEPNNPEPYGRDIDPVDGAHIYQSVKAALPNAKLVVGGISAWCDVAGFGSYYEWVIPFLAECDVLGVEHPKTWHIHGYVEAWITADHIIEWWRLHRELTMADYWITEYGAPDGSVDDFIKLTEFIKQAGWIKRYAAFTNRVNGTEAWLPPGWASTSLISYTTGAFTPTGEYYAIQ